MCLISYTCTVKCVPELVESVISLVEYSRTLYKPHILLNGPYCHGAHLLLTLMDFGGSSLFQSSWLDMISSTNEWWEIVLSVGTQLHNFGLLIKMYYGLYMCDFLFYTKNYLTIL